MNRTTFILLLALAAPAQADTLQVVLDAVERHRSVSIEGWSFDRVTRGDDVMTRERCVGLDIHKAECRLVEIGGLQPSPKELAAYAKRQAQPVEENLPNADPATWIDLGTIELDGRSPGALHVSYRGAVDEGEDYEKLGAIRGVAVVDDGDPMVASLRSASTRSFKPAIGVKISSLVSSAFFQRVGDAVFLKGVEVQGKGRAFGLRTIDIHTVVEFENFQKPE